MAERYYDGHRWQYKTYCESCEALVDDTGPLQKHNQQALSDNICPYCKKPIYTKKQDEATNLQKENDR